MQRISSALSFDGQWFLSVNYGGVTLRDLATGQTTNWDCELGGIVLDATFSRDGRRFAIASYRGFAGVWETASLRPLARLGSLQVPIFSVWFSPDGTRLVTANSGQGALTLWDVETGRELITLAGRGGGEGGFSGDDTWLGCGNGDLSVCLWRAPPWTEIEAAERAREAEADALRQRALRSAPKTTSLPDHYYTLPNDVSGTWGHGILAQDWQDAAGGVPVQPVRFERNTFVNNQKAVAEALGNKSRFINNSFQGPGGGQTSDGLLLSGTNILAVINQFTNLTRGIFLVGDDPGWGITNGIATGVAPIGNQFCDVGTQVFVEPLVSGVTNVGSQTCPFPAPSLACSPPSGLAGTSVTLAGTNLSGATMVLFNGLSATFANAPGADADHLITAIVPAHATIGPVTVLTPQGNITSLAPFSVPVLLGMSLLGSGRVQLSWTADTSDLLLETTADLASPDWQTVSTSPSVAFIGIALLFKIRQPLPAVPQHERCA